MAHYPKPFFRAPRGVWYVQIDGKQHNLGPDKVEAFKTYHGLMQQRAETPAAMQPASGSPLVISICDEFLDWTEKHRAPDTYRWYKDRLESFCKTIEATLSADQLRPHHVQKWVDNYGVPLKSGSRRNLIASVKRAMKWAEEQGYIDHSRIAHMKKPACGRKEQVVTPEQFCFARPRHLNMHAVWVAEYKTTSSPTALSSSAGFCPNNSPSSSTPTLWPSRAMDDRKSSSIGNS
jgi:Phage integrase, N-terminal SAM-like domain